MTIVVNLYGSPGTGKSTTAAGVYYFLKMQHKHCEMVREYIKSWAWEGRTPNNYDQVYLFGKQAKYESLLYGKVDFIITDSPLLLSGFYEWWHQDSELVTKAAREFMRSANVHGVEYINFWLGGHEHFDPRGRNHGKEEVAAIENAMKLWLNRNNVELIDVNVPLDKRVDFILEKLRDRGLGRP